MEVLESHIKRDSAISHCLRTPLIHDTFHMDSIPPSPNRPLDPTRNGRTATPLREIPTADLEMGPVPSLNADVLKDIILSMGGHVGVLDWPYHTPSPEPPKHRPPPERPNGACKSIKNIRPCISEPPRETQYTPSKKKFHFLFGNYYRAAKACRGGAPAFRAHSSLRSLNDHEGRESKSALLGHRRCRVYIGGM